VVRVADHLVGLTSPLRGRVPANVGSLQGEAGAPDERAQPVVCQSSGLIEVDDDYLERVGLLANVRLYNQGFLHLR
jgi:hypothetical protein